MHGSVKRLPSMVTHYFAL